MHILIVTQYFWPESFRINDLAEGLCERGHQVTVIAGTPNYPGGRFFPGYGPIRKRSESWRGVRILRVPQLPRGSCGNVRLALNYLSYALSASVLGPWLMRGKRVDVILVFQMSPATVGWPAVVFKLLKGAPILFWVQDLWPDSIAAAGAINSHKLLKPIEWMLRLFYKSSDRILMQSRAFEEPIKRLGGSPDTLRYLPNSAEAFYRPLPSCEQEARRIRAPEGFRIIYAGNVGAAQDFPTILQAAERLREYRDIQWIILGDGRMRKWVESEVERRRLQSSVHLLGRYPVQEMPALLALGDVLLSTLRRERIFALTIPSKVQSYLACGRPVVAALEGEGGRVVEEAGAGIACRPEDPDELAAAVLQMYHLEPTERAAMGARGRNYFDRHFERELLLSRFEEWAVEVAREGEQ